MAGATSAHLAVLPTPLNPSNHEKGWQFRVWDEKTIKKMREKAQYWKKQSRGYITPGTLDVKPGTLVLFRGRNSLHRVTPSCGAWDRILVVLAYNSALGVALSEAARMTFYGRLG